VAPSGTTTDADETPAGVYDALAPVYDAMGGARFAMLVADRLDPLLSSDRGAFLDLGCGTGALLCALRERHPGWRLSGVDVSPGMLAVARRKPAGEGVLWARVRLPGPLPFTERFDVVGAFYDTLNHLADLDTLGATFRAVAALLRPGGRLLFDLNNAFGFETWWRYRVAFDVEGHHIDSELGYDRRARTAHAAIRLGRGAAERRFLLRQRCFPEAEVEGALLRAGLTPEIAAPWSPVNPDSPSKTWFVATKRHGMADGAAEQCVKMVKSTSSF
jgi:SAM-dependent methyltransferase